MPQLTRGCSRTLQKWSVAGLALLGAACGDSVLPTAPLADFAPIRRIQEVLGLRAPTTFSCEVSTRVAGGPGSVYGSVRPFADAERARNPRSAWRHGRGTLRFDPAERASDGAVILYRFRGYEDGDRLVGTADCVIPRTERAVRTMNARFGVPDGPPQAHPLNRLAPTGPRSGDTQCADGVCALANLYVSACSWGGIWPNCYSRPQSQAQLQCGAMDPSCAGWGGGGDPWSWDGGGGSDPSPPPDTTRPCATPYALLNDSTVQQRFSEAWAASSSEAPMSQRREQGGWIIRTPDGRFAAEPFPAAWRSTPCGIAIPAGAAAPAGSLAMYHTHPFRRGELLTACDPQDLPGGRTAFVNYRNESSIADDSALVGFRERGAANLIGIILDADKLTAYDGSSVNQIAIDRCGY